MLWFGAEGSGVTYGPSTLTQGAFCSLLNIPSVPENGP